jgi:hypothetical protein
MESEKCLKSCKKECYEEYFNFIANDLEIPEEKENYEFIYKIESRNLPEFQYIFEAKYSFIIYMSNIGGIVSLWFGLAVIDINIIIKRLFIYLKMYSIRYMKFDYLLQTMRTIRILKYLPKLIEFTILLINRLDSLNFKLMAKLICFPLFLYQVIELTIIYLNFSTSVSVQLITTVNGSLISIESIPALTVCHENKLKKNFFSPEKLIEIENHIQEFNLNYSLSSKIKSTEYLNETTKKILSFYDYLLRKSDTYFYKEILEFLVKIVQNFNDEKFFTNTIPSNEEMNFYSNHFNCVVGIDRMPNYRDFGHVFSSVSLKNNKNFSTDSLKQCYGKCRVSCDERLFIVEFSFNVKTKPNLDLVMVDLDFDRDYYMNIIYSPNMLFMQYIIGVVNLMSSWHGIDFISMKDQFFAIIGLFLTKIRAKNIFNKIFYLLLNSEQIRIFFIFSKIFKAVVKNSQVLFIHILLGFHFF